MNPFQPRYRDDPDDESHRDTNAQAPSVGKLQLAFKIVVHGITFSASRD